MAHKNIFEEWLDIATEFKDNADAVLKEVHRCKQDMWLLRNEILERIDAGQFIRDDKRIVISAPEIIIGNVDRHGVLQESGKVIIKGSSTVLQGVGDVGSVTVMAPCITNVAANPGIDGMEYVVGKTSRVVTIARKVQIESQSPEELKDRGALFVERPSGEGVQILSEKGITLSATKDDKKRKDRLEESVKSMKQGKAHLTRLINTQMNELKSLVNDISSNISKDELLSASDDLGRANMMALDELSAGMESDSMSFSLALKKLAEMTSKLAELNRKIACYENEQTKMVGEEDYKKKPNGSSLTLKSENINLYSQDGEDQWRTNPESGIDIRGNNIKLRSLVEKDALAAEDAKSRITIQSRNIDVTTANLADPSWDKDTHELLKGKFPLEGNVTISSKTLNISAVDLEQTEKGKLKETALTDNSEVNIRAKNVRVKTHDKDGKNVGKFSVNSQKIVMKATDIDDYKADLELDNQGNTKRPKVKSKAVTENSEMLLIAEKMNIGYKKKEMKTKKLTVYAGESTTLMSDKMITMGQGADLKMQNLLKMSSDGSKLFSTKETTVNGKSKVNIVGNSDFKGKITAGDIEAKNVKASGSLSSSNFGDGINVPTQAVNSEQAAKADVDDMSL